ncbi:MAG: hypothetical protein GX633_06420 [Clostridiales bacterium]|jgi:hypothetical protein|nr:hypothetical protein [Clostridiales bacterium]
MNCIRTKLENVLRDRWGTIGPLSVSTGEAIAKKLKANPALLLHSAGAALESTLRSLELSFGDEVICAAVSYPADSMTCAAVGCVPVFCDVDKDRKISVSSAESCVTDKTKAIISDSADEKSVETLRAFADKHNIKLVLNLKSIYEYTPACVDCYACVIAFPSSGVAVANEFEAYEGIFAYHNCGRPIINEATLVFDKILGGDMRISEWQAAIIADIVENDKEYCCGIEQKFMADSEAFSSDYFEKQTGRKLNYEKSDFPGACAVLWGDIPAFC